MGIDTNTKVEDLENVADGQGGTAPPAARDEQEKTNDRLGNHPSLNTASHSTSGTAAESLPSNSVPEGVTVVVVPDPANAGTVWVGNSNAQPIGLSSKDQTFETQVENTDAISVQTPNAGDTVHLVWEG